MTSKRTVAALCAAALPVLAAVGCGSTKPGYADQALTTKVPASATAAAAPAPAPKLTGVAGKPPSPISADLSKKPKIPKPTGDPPTKLLTKDIVVGKGTAAKKGDTLTVRYVGVTWSAGTEFDASWGKTPDTFDFPVGQGRVIPGWDAGIPGMKVGGRRELAIPSAQAYGATGSAPKIGPDEALVFVVDLVKIA